MEARCITLKNIGFLSWDVWLRDVLAYVMQGDPYTRANSVVDQLYSAYGTAEIDSGVLSFGELLIDSILLGYFNIPGLQCHSIPVPCIACPRNEPCDRWVVWRRLYPKDTEADRRNRMCAFLLIHIPGFSRVSAERVGIFSEAVFGV